MENPDDEEEVEVDIPDESDSKNTSYYEENDYIPTTPTSSEQESDSASLSSLTSHMSQLSLKKRSMSYFNLRQSLSLGESNVFLL